jgi:hypothetical protein
MMSNPPKPLRAAAHRQRRSRPPAAPGAQPPARRDDPRSGAGAGRRAGRRGAGDARGRAPRGRADQLHLPVLPVEVGHHPRARQARPGARAACCCRTRWPAAGRARRRAAGGRTVVNRLVDAYFAHYRDQPDALAVWAGAQSDPACASSISRTRAAPPNSWCRRCCASWTADVGRRARARAADLRGHRRRRAAGAGARIAAARAADRAAQEHADRDPRGAQVPPEEIA